MQRIIKFSKYRNLGKENENNTLVLNRTMEKGKMGDLVIVIGPNNSGKSNVLDGITSIGHKLTKRDETELSLSDEDKKPEITLALRDENNHKIIMSYSSNEAGSHIYTASANKIELEEPTKEQIIKFKNSIKALGSITNNIYLRNLNENVNINILINYAYQFYKLIVDPANANNQNYKNIYTRLSNEDDYVLKYFNSKSNSVTLNDLNYECWNTNNVNFFTRVIKYEEKQITKNDLSVDIKNLSTSIFFNSVFKYIDIDPKNITNAYLQYEKFSNIASLNKIKKEITKKAEVLNQRFNELYFTGKDKYVFSLDLSTGNKICFGMARGEDEFPIFLEYQSTGFKWFFNLFFNFLCSNELKPGDIIIMDEPATHLHPQGQTELRKFIKEFAKQNDLTFVIATHMPFLIDVDNYDELRVISTNDNWAEIHSDFHAVDNNDPDSLRPIKESLTIKQNVLYDIDTEIIWVEGITDYNYLTMFKNLLGRKNIAFLPFNGVQNNDADQKELIKKLCATRFYKVGLLVDGDKAGLKMLENCKNTILSRGHAISELSKDDKKFMMIEELFSNDDKAKYDLSSSDKTKKSANKSATMKGSCNLDDFSDETKANFNALFDLLQD